MTVPKVRVVVADDERPARAFLTSLLRLIPDVDIVGEASNGAEAIQLVEQHRPDVALLDLQMPEIDGMSVVRLLRRRYLPLVVFVTAYDDYAVKAFEVNAVDYLTKPVSEPRLRETLRRIRERLERDDLKEAATADLREAVRAYDAGRPVARLDRIPVRRKDDILLLPVSQVASV
jgi:DNA-binding LytR/AlgR family response regulator